MNANAIIGGCIRCGNSGTVALSCTTPACKEAGYCHIPGEFYDAIPIGTHIPTIGLRFNDYLAVDRLGAGGAGEVFRALDVQTGEYGALKVLGQSAAGDSSAQFEREAIALARLSHPNIVRLLDFGQEGEQAYIVMELVDGGKTLNDLLNDGIDNDTVIDILTQTAMALSDAHRHGFVHRDIKPTNIMVEATSSRDHHVRIIDLGLAKYVEVSRQTCLVAGTPSYMAPEQMFRQNIGPWTDWFALGVIAGEFLAGCRPFDNRNWAEVFTLKRDPDHDPLGQIADMDLPQNVQSFLRHALRYDPAKRIGDAHTFCTELRRAFHGLEEMDTVLERRHRESDSAETDAQTDAQTDAETLILDRPPFETSTGGDNEEATFVMERSGSLPLSNSMDDTIKVSVDSPRNMPVSAPPEPEASTDTEGCLAQISRRVTNLPATVHSFVGRRKELNAAVSALKSGHRLLTIKGGPGAGKSRIAQRLGIEQLGRHPGGVWFCDLSTVRSREGVFGVLARALQWSLTSTDPCTEIGQGLSQIGRAMLILDNFEHLLTKSSQDLVDWLAAASEIRIVTTSRERLKLPQEAVIEIGPLNLQDASRLFIERARRLEPSFASHLKSNANIEALVKQMDCLPLAIELTAAQVGRFSIAEITKGLARQFTKIVQKTVKGDRDDTLSSAIDWSWSLLSPAERWAFVQCSVFRGGFTREAAASILVPLGSDRSTRVPVDDLLNALVDKSLLRRVESDWGHERFDMYDSLRRYASERLLEKQTDATGIWLNAPGMDAYHAIRRRHCQYFSKLGSSQGLEVLYGPMAVGARQNIEVELANLERATKSGLRDGQPDWAALAWLAAWSGYHDVRGPHRHCAEEAEAMVQNDGLSTERQVQLLHAAARGWFLHGDSQGHERLAEEGLKRARRSSNHRFEGRFLKELAEAAHLRTGLTEGQALVETAISVLEKHGKPRDRADALSVRGLFAVMLGDFDGAQKAFDDCLRTLQGQGDVFNELTYKSNLAASSLMKGDLEIARTYFNSALELARTISSRMYGLILGQLGTIHLRQDNEAQAEALYRQSVEILSNAWPISAAFFRSRLATIWARQGKGDAARGLLDQAEAFARRVSLYEAGRILCARAEVEHISGNKAGAQQALEDAVTIRDDLELDSASPLGKQIMKVDALLTAASHTNP